MSAAATIRSRTSTAAFGVAAIVAVQFVAMTVLAAILGTWQDEEYTLATTAHGVGFAVHRAISYELQAPFYFLVLAALRTVDPSPFFARMFSVVAACLLTPLAARIALRIWPKADPRLFTAFVAFNPFVVFAAVEIRLYALAILVSAALWLAFDRGYLSESRLRARIALVLLGIAAAYLQYFLVFELAGFATALIVARRWRSLVAYAIAMAAVAVAFIPLGLVLRSQVGGEFGVRVALPGAYGSVFVHPLLDFVIPLGFQAVIGPFAHVVAQALAAVLIALLIVGRPALDRRRLAIVSIAVTVECLYAIVENVLHYELVVPRHFVALFIAELAALYAIVSGFRAKWPAARAVACLVALAIVASLGATYRTLSKQGDWPRVAAMLAKDARAGDTIAVFPADGVRPFLRYYRGYARVVPFPRALSTTSYDTSGLVISSTAEASAALRTLASRRGRLWLVRAGGCTSYDFYGCVELQKAVGQHFRIVGHNDFYTNEVLRLEPLVATSYAVRSRARKRAGISS